MTEQLIEGRAPDTLHEAVEPTPELARKNTRFAWALVALFLLLFCGTFLIGLTYLWVD
ncbi:MAG TPA: hypothetical protein VH721_07220 [Gaiellaceae bacterium]|jgi:hypothetical protein